MRHNLAVRWLSSSSPGALQPSRPTRRGHLPVDSGETRFDAAHPTCSGASGETGRELGSTVSSEHDWDTGVAEHFS